MIEQPADFLRVLEDEAAASRRENADRCGYEALAWLTLPPVWTEELAAKVPFPESRLSRTEFLAECEKLGWCVRRPAGVTVGPEEAADLLVRVLGELAVTATDTSIRNQVVEAAVAAIEQIGTPSHRQDLSKRLLAMPGLTAETAGRVRKMAESDGSATEPDPTEAVRRLIAVGARQELDELLGEVRPADLQRILATPADIPPDSLGTALRRAVAECPPRVTARILATTALQLSRELVLELSAALRERAVGERGADGILTSLAIALASVGDRKEALAISDRLADDRLRARALAVVAEFTASGPDRTRRLKSIVETIAHVIVEGEGVDLAGAADAVTRLARAGALAAARPVIEVVHQGLSPGRLLPADVGALVSISIELGHAVGYTTDATRFAEVAVEAARGLGDPVARAAGLTRVLAVAQDHQNELIDEAVAAARAIVDANDRAAALARLVPHATQHNLADVVRELVASIRPIDPGQAFWVPDAARADILAELEVKGLPWLRRTANEIAGALLRVESPGLVPTAVRRWAILAATLAPKDEAGNKAGDALLKHVEPLLRSGDVAEALGWIEAGRQLLSLVHGAFETSLLVATRLVELEQRRADDRRLLQRFLARKEQVTAFERLLQVPDGEEPWALHYLGHGGVGKTMMVRHIAAELAPAQGRIVARIDFDHLNPEYPLRRPGQLLLNILEELEAYADAETRPLYEDASTFLRHQNWWRTDAHQRPSTSALSHAVQRFCTFVRALPPGVVLILDTCEELAKFQPSGAVLPQLDAAFQLIERVHKEVPSVRVVLAGRRPLASTVHGGRTLNPERAFAASLPAEKTYLDVCEVAGFTNAEARRYLRVMEGLTLPDDTVRELLVRSPDKPEVPFYSGDQAKRRTSRHVPFDLAQYATILRDYPTYLTHHPRSQAYVTYVRDRIVLRQGPYSKSLLPVVVLLRRFDRAMLAAANQNAESALDEAWQEFATTEWISTHVDKDLKTTFLEVDRAMLERLEAYYRAPEHERAYETARQRAADGLDGLVRTRSLAGLTVDLVDAALRCLPRDRAAALCDALALRVARDGFWIWAYNVFGRVLGVDGALADPRHLAAASATALYTTALAQINPAEDYRSQWAESARQAMQHPATPSIRWLQARAEVLAEPADTLRWRRAMQLVDELMAGDDGDRGRAAWLVGTTLAAARDIVDTAAEHRLSTGAADWERVAAPLLDHGFGPQVSAVTAVLLARGFLLDGNAARAGELFAHALADTEGPDWAPTAAEAAVDGAVPRDPRDRVRLEALLAGMVEEIPDEWLWQAVAEVADPDSDRLASLLLSVRLDQRPVSAGDLERVRDAVGKLPPPPAAIYAHRLVPPLRIALSRCWLALGRLSDARSALGGRTAFTLEAGQQQLLDMARVEVSRRLRLPRTDTAVRTKLRDSLPLVQAMRVHEAAVLLGEPPSARPDLAGIPEEVHVWWRISPGLAGLAGQKEVADAVELAPDWARNRPLAQAAAILDAAELAYLRDGRRPEESYRDVAAWPLGAWSKQYPDRLEDVWRVALRAAALSDDPEAEVEGLGMKRKDALADVPRPGRRRLAELALEEGELLALRLPERGACLLDAAARWFHDADDGVGCLIAYTAARLADWRARRHFLLQELKEIYSDARRLGADLPDWPKLQQKVGRSVGAELAPWRGNQAWEGWLRRLTWLIASAGSTMRRELDPQSTAVPPELRRAKPPDSLERRLQSVVGPGGKKPTAGYGNVRLASRRNRVTLGAGATLGAALLALILYGFFARAVGTLPVLKVQPLRVAAYVCALLGIACYVLLFMASGPRNNSARVMIRGGQRPDAAEIAIVGVIVRRWPLRAKVKTTSSVVSLAGSTVLDSGETDVHRMLALISRRRHPLRVSLSVARGIAHVPWERWLASPLTEPPALYMERSNPEYLGSPVDLERSGGTYWVLAPQRWRSLMLAALPAESAKSARGFPEASPEDVIVVVGTAVDTGAGRRLVVGQGRSAEDLIIEPDGAAAVAVNVVIVGEPGLTDSLQLAAESAAALRDCATDLVQAGVHLAIVVPSTSADKASAVLAALAPALRPGVDAADRDRAVFAARRELASGDVVGFGYELTVMRRPEVGP
jgi:hypothetical protein